MGKPNSSRSNLA